MRGKKKLMIEELKRQLGVVTAAAKQVGINRVTHYKWMNEDPEYKLEVEHIDDIALDFAESMLFKMMQDKTPSAIIFYLKTKGKKRGYIEKSEQLVEHTGESLKIIIEEKKPDGDKPSTES